MTKEDKYFKIETENLRFFVKAQNIGIAINLIENRKWDYVEVEEPSITDIIKVGVADKSTIARLKEDRKIEW